MFPRTSGFGNPFQQFAVNPLQAVNPFTAAVNFGGINPLAQLLNASAINPYAGPYAGAPVQGFNPINPFVTSPYGWGVTPNMNPVIAAQLATLHPAVLSHLVSQAGIAPGEFGNPYNTRQYNPATPWLGGVGHFAGQSLGMPFGQGISPLGAIGQSPYAGVNPNVFAQPPGPAGLAGEQFGGSLMAQQLNPLAQQQLPVRPLIGGHQFNPLLP